MTPEEAADAAKPAVVELGMAFGHEPSFVACAERLGLGSEPWPFYFGGRAGLLGPVDVEVVSAACGFFGPEAVRAAWGVALAADRLDEIGQAYLELCVDGGRRHLGGLPGVERLAELTQRAVESADASGRVLFAAWRACPDPAQDAPARAALNLLRLREHRGASHLIAVVSGGLTPLQAILAGPGVQKAGVNGWRPPFAEVSDGAARLSAVERQTDVLAGQPYAVLSTDQRTELVTLLRAAHRSWRASTTARHT